MTGRERNLAVLTGVVLGGYVLWSSVAAPAFASWRALGDQLATAEQAVVRDRALGAAMSFLQAERAALDARLRPPPGEPVTPWLLAHLRALGQEAGLDPSALRVVGARELDLPAAPAAGAGARPAPAARAPARGARGQPAKAPPPWAELVVELKARVALDKLQAFLVRLAASDRLVRVTSLSLAPRQEGTDLDAQMTMSALVPRELVEDELPDAGRRP